jgi:L-fucose isomerase-like protein
MNNSKNDIAFIPIARTTFDIELAKQKADLACESLRQAGHHVIGLPELITDQSSLINAISEFDHQPPDLIVLFQATFADSSMVMTLAQKISAPILFWAVPEERTGARLRLNSFCGINLAAHALKRQSIYYDYVYAQPTDQSALTKIAILARAGHVKRFLRNAKVGVIGEHPPGMDTCHLDAELLRSIFGVQIIQFDLSDIFARARSVNLNTIQSIRTRLDRRLDKLATLNQEPLNGTFSAYEALKQIAIENKLVGLAVRCWPEFFTELGCAACGAMSMLTDEKIPCSCEADINGTITQIILQWLSDSQSFGSDLVQIDFEDDSAVLWHCGLAPLAMADPDFQPHGSIHSNRRVPLVMDFPLMPGQVTLCRITQSPGSTGSPLRLVAGIGEMISAKPSFSGTSGVLKFFQPAKVVLDIILNEGLEHHISLTYGNYYSELIALAKMLNLPVLTI